MAAPFDEAVARHNQGRLSEAALLYESVLRRDPKHFGALHGLGLVAAAQSRHDDAVRLLRKALNQSPNVAEAQCDLGNALFALGRHDEAIPRYEKALALRRDFPEAENNLGNALQALGLHEDAAQRYQRALALAPDFAPAHHNLANSLWVLAHADEAMAHYEAALALMPESAPVHYNFANALRETRRYDAAVAQYEAALAVRPAYPAALNNLGMALEALGRPDEAVARYEAALDLDPRLTLAHNNLGNALRALSRPDAAVARYEAALALAPGYAEARHNLGNALLDLRRPDAALAQYEGALALRPDYAEAVNGLSNALLALGRSEAAVERYRQAIALDPRLGLAHYNLGVALYRLGRYPEALASYRRAIALDPGDGRALSAAAMLSRRMCRWADDASDRKALIAAVDGGVPDIAPLVLSAVVDDPSRQSLAARRSVAHHRLDRLPPLWDGAVYRHDKIRLAYFCGHFRSHPMSFLMAELFERHDRSLFEVIALSWGADDGSSIRRRIERSFDRFIEVGSLSDIDLARHIRALEIDIVVDITGITENGRLAVLARRPAPIQVSYLAAPMTSGAEFMDYILVDPFIVPADQQPHFAEKLVHLPDCYLVTDSTQEIAEPAPSRAECGLPESGFVFACFNNPYKIAPQLFDIWMRLLRAVPGSVLWLLGDNPSAIENLRREAAAREVAPDRLVFAARCPLPLHLARHRRADLFLDALPLNAHTTASDALWAGLPLVTCPGRGFAARVAGSILHAVGLPELVTGNLDEYEALALDLARTPARRDAIRRRLAENRLRAPLFDTDRFRRNIEAAYHEMWRTWQCGEPPRAFAVPGG
ncbi:MAG: tetratricopeptide repeat protein [Alphaproteobacteria bacterium]|nr:tetratricopeptide repeat protein [Alphaproteobacteria bacterium]